MQVILTKERQLFQNVIALTSDRQRTYRRSAGVALDLWGDYSDLTWDIDTMPAGVALDLWGDYSRKSIIVV